MTKLAIAKYFGCLLEEEEERSQENMDTISFVSVGWPRINIWKKGSVLAAEGNSGHSPCGCSGAPLGLGFKSVWI